MHRLIPMIVESKTLHLRFLNTLSYLENCGARKIAACEHPTLVKELMLKHAAEEFRHAYILKKQMHRIGTPLPTYESSSLLGGVTTLRYLDKLELSICRFLRQQNCSLSHAYLLITYAIEKRAEALYPLYEKYLRQNHSPITVKSIALEEEGHLQEIETALLEYQEGIAYSKIACHLEQKIYTQWHLTLQKELLPITMENYE